MSDQAPVTPLFIHTYSARYSCAFSLRGMSLVFAASITAPVANQATYMPVTIPFFYPVNRVFWVNGTSVTSTNRAFGIYTQDGTLIYATASTAAVGASVTQYVTPASPFILAPGGYYFAMVSDTTTANRGGAGNTATLTVQQRALCGILQEGSALPLPATMTPVTVANAYHPLCGITRTITGF